MAGKTLFHPEHGGFFPKLARAACEGASGTFDDSADKDQTLLQAKAYGAAAGPALPCCSSGLTPPQPFPGPLPLSGGFTGGGTTGLALTIAGDVQAADAAMTITGLSVDGLTFDPVHVDLALGDTPQDAAAKIAAALEGLQDTTAAETLHASASGGVVNVSATGGGSNLFDADPVATWP